MKKNIYYFIAAIFIFSGLFSACELQDTIAGLSNLDKIDDAVPVVEENTSIMIKVGDVFENVNNLVGNSDLKSIDYSNEPEITRVGNIYTLNYNNVSGYSGKIVIDFSGEPLFETMHLSATVSCIDFVDNGFMFNGKMKFALVEFNLNGIDKYTLESVDVFALTKNSETTTIDFSFEIQSDKTILSDVVLLYSGYLNQQKSEDVHKIEIIEDVYQGMDCEYPKFGVVNNILYYNTDDELNMTVDYGVNEFGESNSECDAYVKFSLGGVSSVIKLD